MPKVKIDYSNTIFYKIYCKDPYIKELYIGHTTNFVQRKYAHKQSCINPKSANYNCKVYKIIRDNMGWDNWAMEIIAFHNCEDLYSAKKQEQHYFEEYKATLNSIEPLPPRNPNKEVVKHKNELMPKFIIKFECEKCNFKCHKLSNYNKHLLTRKHILLINSNEKNSNTFKCNCGKEYKHMSSLCNHKKTCKKIKESEWNKLSELTDNDDTHYGLLTKIILELVKKNDELVKKNDELTSHIIEMSNNINKETVIDKQIN